MNTVTTCHDTLRLAEQLISKPSVTPKDEGSLDLIADDPNTEALIVQGAVTAVLAGADKVVVKTRTEALGVPDPQSNADAVAMSRYAMDLCLGSTGLAGPEVEDLPAGAAA